MNASTPPPPSDPWAPGVRAAEVPVAEGDEPNSLDTPVDVPPNVNEEVPNPTKHLFDEVEETAAPLRFASAENATPASEPKSALITLITKRDEPSLMSKRISLDADGKLKSDGSACLMVTGTAERIPAETAGDLARIIGNCRSDQAIALGALKEELAASVAVTIPKRLDKHPGAITRSRGYIAYRPGVPAWCLIDFDTKGMPDEVQAKIDAAGGMWRALLTVAPDLADAARVSRASTSAGLFRSDSNQPVAGPDGMHHYVLLLDGSDIERFLKDLHDGCWLHGFGWHRIGTAGQLLDRSLVDRMVGFGERLCFEGAPDIIPPLAQDQAKREPEAFQGDAIHSDHVVRPLSEYERHLVNEAKKESKKALGRSAAEVRNMHDKELAEKITAKSGTPAATALRLVQARHRGVLYPGVELEFDHLGIVTVGAVLADPNRYVEETLADPMEGVDYGRCKAMVMRGHDGNLLIHSFAHGRGIYYLRYDLKSAKGAFEQVPGGGTVDHAMAILAQADIETDELDEFIRFVSKTTGVGIRPLSARTKKERKERDSNAHKASIEASMELTAGGRIVRTRPEPDGELLPIVSLLDDLLANDDNEEPPMRNASGAIVRVEEKEPWALHLLTSEGANAEEESEQIKPPAEPILVELTATGVELLLESYVAWFVVRKDGSAYFAALPKAFIVALMEYPNSARSIRLHSSRPRAA